MTSPITCSGNDLAAVLDGLRRDGYKPWAWNTGVGGNAGYEIEFYSVSGRTGLISEVTGKSELVTTNGRNPTRHGEPVNFAGKACSTQAGHVKPREATEHERSQTVAVAVVDGEHAGISLPEPHVAATAPVKKTELRLASGNSISPHQGETPEDTAAPDSVKSAVAPRNSLNDPKSPCYGSASGEVPACAKTAGVVLSTALSLDTALARLERVVKQRIARTSRFKSMKEARVPHAND